MIFLETQEYSYLYSLGIVILVLELLSTGYLFFCDLKFL